MTLTTSPDWLVPANVLEAEPARVRAGRPFEPIQEKELDNPLRQLASRLPGGKQGVYVVPEFVGANGVADLVAVTRADSDLHDRLGSAVPFLGTLTLATVAACIPVGRTISLDHLSHVLHMSARQCASYARELESIGAIARVGSGYRRNNSLRPIGRMYAFEAKVSDWNRALGQAVRYLSWTDSASIVLLRPPADLPSVMTHVRSMNVGLAVGTTWVIRPRLSPLLNPTHAGGRLLASEQFARSVTHRLDLAL